MKLFAVLFACVCLSASALQLRQEGLSKVSAVVPATEFNQDVKDIQQDRDTMEASELDIVAATNAAECDGYWWCSCQGSDPWYPRCCKCYPRRS